MASTSPSLFVAALCAIESARDDTHQHQHQQQLPWEVLRATATGKHLAEPTLADLMNAVHRPDVRQRVLAKLTGQLDSVGDMDDMLFRAGGVVAVDEDKVDDKVHPLSATGLFLRSYLLDYDQLTFEQSVMLLARLKALVAAGGATAEHNNQLLPRWQIDYFIEDVLHQLLEGTCTISTAELDRICDRIAAQVPAVFAPVHFVRYHNHLRGRELLKAEEALHRLFDYVFAKSEKEQSQFALLSLADLYARFGFADEALQIVAEAVRTCRRLNDSESLATALYFEGRLHQLKRLQASGAASSSPALDRAVAVPIPLNLTKHEKALTALSHQRRIAYLGVLRSLASVDVGLGLGASESQIVTALYKAGVLIDSETMLPHVANTELLSVHDLIACRVWGLFSLPPAPGKENETPAAWTSSSVAAPSAALAQRLADVRATVSAAAWWSALPVVLEIISEAKKSSYHELYLDAIVVLARVYMHTPTKQGGVAAVEAAQLLEAVMPQIVGSKNNQVKGDGLLVHAESQLALASSAQPVPEQRLLMAAQTSALDALHAFESLVPSTKETLQSREACLRLAIRIHRALGYAKEEAETRDQLVQLVALSMEKGQ